MPRVPTYQPGQVGPVQTTNARFRAADAPNGLDMLAEGFKGLAGLADQQDKINYENDETQARLALSTGRQQVAGQVDSFKGLQLGQARAGQEGFNAGLDKIKSDLLATAKTTRQRQMIEQGWLDIDAPARRMGASWALSQSREETKLSFGTEQTALIESALSSDDPQFRDHVGLQVRDNVRRRLEFEGYDLKQNPQVLAVEEKAALSKLHAGMGDRMFSTDEPDIPAIGEYVTAYGDEMTADVRNDFLKRLQGPLQGRMAKADADHFMGLAGPAPEVVKPNAQPGVANLDAITIRAESGGNPNAVSPVGARGLMQVMPATARDPGFGIRPSDGSQQDDVRVGKAYRAKMEQRYGGDLAKMWAAYNWGPGALDNAIKKHGDNWLDHAPAETKAYVRKNIAAVGSSGTAYQPAPAEIDRGGAYDALNRAVQAGEISPERADRARLEIDRRTRVNESLLNDQRQRADDQAADFVATKGAGFTSISQLPRSVRNTLPPRMLAQYEAIAEKNRSPKPVEANGGEVVALHRMAIVEPEKFAKLDLRKYQSFMTAAEFDELGTSQARASKPTAGTPTDPRPKIDATITRQKKWSGIDADADATQGFRVRRYMEARADEAKAAGKEPAQGDYDRWFGEATATIKTTRTFLGIDYLAPDGEAKATNVLSSKYREVIRSQFRSKFGRAPTEDETQEWFKRMGDPNQ